MSRPEPAPLNPEQQVRWMLLVLPTVNVAGSNRMMPLAPAALAPLCTPGRSVCPLSDSTVPIASSIVQGTPGQLAATCWWSASMAGGLREEVAGVAKGWASMPKMAAAEPITAVPDGPTTRPIARTTPMPHLVGCVRPRPRQDGPRRGTVRPAGRRGRQSHTARTSVTGSGARRLRAVRGLGREARRARWTACQHGAWILRHPKMARPAALRGGTCDPWPSTTWRW